MADITKLAKGTRLSFDTGAAPALLTVDAVFRTPRASILNRPIQPFASVIWDDGGRDYVNLRDLEGRFYSLVTE